MTGLFKIFFPSHWSHVQRREWYVQHLSPEAYIGYLLLREEVEGWLDEVDDAIKRLEYDIPEDDCYAPKAIWELETRLDRLESRMDDIAPLL